MEGNPERVVFLMGNDGEATYTGTLTHAGIIQQGLPRATFIQARELVSGGLYGISEIGPHAGRQSGKQRVSN